MYVDDIRQQGGRKQLESRRWENGRVGGGGEGTRCQKSERKISAILHQGIRRDRTVYLSTVAWEVQEGIAICQQSQRRMEHPLWHCQGSSYWVWVSLSAHRNTASHSQVAGLHKTRWRPHAHFRWIIWKLEGNSEWSVVWHVFSLGNWGNTGFSKKCAELHTLPDRCIEDP